MPNLSPSTRRYLYRVTAAALPIAAAVGLVADNVLPLILNFAAALILGVADSNLSGDGDPVDSDG